MSAENEFETSLKSTEIEDWFDVHVMRPAGYILAKGFAHFGTHPNTVTILSIVVGICSSFFFVSGSFYYKGLEGLIMNIIAALLLYFCGLLDNTDGQLARLTGKSSQMGRFLDGIAAFFFYPVIYYLIFCRIRHNHSLEFAWLNIADTPQNALIFSIIACATLLFSGFVCFASQMRTLDYYIQAHLFFQHGGNRELEDTSKLKDEYNTLQWNNNFWEKLSLKLYTIYTKSQEKATPKFQQFKKVAIERFGAPENFPDNLRLKFCQNSRGVMKFALLLSFNFRTAMLVLFCLLDIPFEYFIFEIFVLSPLCLIAIRRHENFCERLAKEALTIN